MARARSIKPGYFTHEVLAGELPPLHRILFAGLWCHADRRGVLEDRPRFLKTVILPYDDCDLNAMLNDLAAKGFVVGYRVGENKCLFVRHFLDHQNPHRDEKESKLPGPETEGAVITRGLVRIGDGTIGAQCQHGANTVSAPCESGSDRALTFNPVPLTLNPVTDSSAPPASVPAADPPKQETLLTEQEAEATSSVSRVLTHYLKALKANGFAARDTDDKRKLIAKCLKDKWTPDELMLAIDGFTWSDWHMGRDPKTRGQKYCGIEYVLGDNPTIERWLNEQREREAREAG